MSDFYLALKKGRNRKKAFTDDKPLANYRGTRTQHRARIKQAGRRYGEQAHTGRLDSWGQRYVDEGWLCATSPETLHDAMDSLKGKAPGVDGVMRKHIGALSVYQEWCAACCWEKGKAPDFFDTVFATTDFKNLLLTRHALHPGNKYHMEADYLPQHGKPERHDNLKQPLDGLRGKFTPEIWREIGTDEKLFRKLVDSIDRLIHLNVCQIEEQYNAKVKEFTPLSQADAGGNENRKDQQVVSHDWAAMRFISKQLRDGRYALSPLREVEFEKTGGGTRKLSLPVITDRIVEKAAEMVLTPSLEPRFMPQSLGFRHEADRFWALAALVKRFPAARGRYVLSADIQKAFDFVRHEDVKKAIDHFVVNPEFRQHLYRLVARPNRLRKPDVKTGVGIGQGSPLSPVILNMVMHLAVDVPFTEKLPPRLGYIRYADDLLVAFLASEAEAQGIKRVFGKLLEPLGLALHDKEPKTVIVNLDEAPLQRYLGLQLRKDGNQLAVELTPGWREDVRETFEEAALKVEAYDRKDSREAHFAHCGEAWMRAQGPAYRRDMEDEIAEAVAAIAREVSRYGSAVLPKDVRNAWRHGHGQWTALLASNNIPNISQRPLAIHRGQPTTPDS